MKTILSLKNISLLVHLGEGAKERSKPQEVLISIQLKHLNTPSTVLQDTLKDGINYETIVASLSDLVTSRSFHLIEHLSYTCYQCIKKMTPLQNTLIQVLAHKIHPPLSNLKDGVSFLYGDEF